MRRVFLPTLVTAASLTRRGTSSKQHVGFPQGAGRAEQPSAGKNKDQGLLSSSGQSGERDIFIKQTNQPTKKTTECNQAWRIPQVRVSLFLLWAWKGSGEQHLEMVWRQEDAGENGEFSEPEGVGHPAPIAPEAFGIESVQSFLSNKH